MIEDAVDEFQRLYELVGFDGVQVMLDLGLVLTVLELNEVIAT